MTPAGRGSRDQVASIVTLSQIGHHCITSLTIKQMGESNANSHLFTFLMTIVTFEQHLTSNYRI